MNQEKKLEKVLESALSEDLDDYFKLLKVLKKKLPFFGRTKRIAASLLKELLGDISKLDLDAASILGKTETGKIIFEDIKDGRARLFINVGKNQNISTGDLSTAFGPAGRLRMPILRHTRTWPSAAVRFAASSR